VNILIVDDSPTMLGILHRTLTQGGHSVTTAGNGEEALVPLARHDFDLIISDLNMVHLGGFELLLEVRASRRHAATPFIFLTTEFDADLKSAARKAGATAWMVKPFEPGPLLDLVARFEPADRPRPHSEPHSTSIRP
jgi:two-component system, chemotaxis family, chemotaxis protein CheY